jgi:hypothetical protein
MDEMYDVMFNEGLIQSPEQLEKVKRDGRYEMAIQAVQGEIKNREFSKATDRVLSGDLSLEFSADQRTKIIETIEKEKMAAAKNDLEVKKLKNEEIELKKKDQQDQFFSSMIKDISTSKSPAQANSTFEKSTQALAQGLLTVEQHRYINSVMNGSRGQYNERLQFDYHNKILKTTDGFDAIQNEIVSSVGSQGMDASTGNALLSMLNTRKETVSKDPSSKVRFSLANDFLDASFGKDSFFEPLDQPRKLAKVQASEFMHKLISDGVDPLDAAKKASVKFAKPLAAVPLVPGIDYKLQSDPNGLVSAKRQLKFQFDNGKLTKEEYAARIRLLNSREQAVRSQIEIEQLARPPKTEGE